MLQTALLFIKQKLDEYLLNSFELDESVTVLNHLVAQDGSSPAKNHNKMVITLINLDYDTTKPFYGGIQRGRDNQVIRSNPGNMFNVDLLFTACFDDYEEALKFLNATISYYQNHMIINRSVAPDLPEGMKALTFEIANSTYFETHNLWSAMGAKYQPSIIYKVRHVNVQSDDINVVVPAVTNVSNSTVGPRQ